VHRTFGWTVVGTLAFASACGDNTIPPVGAPLEHSDTLFLGAHEDDDLLFMQPELLARLRQGASTTTIYATTAGPSGRGAGILDAAKMAYGKIAGSQAWDCGQIQLGTIVVEHCRLRDRPISLVDLGIPDGGIEGALTNSLLHLFDGTVQRLPAAITGGVSAGDVTRDSIVDLFTQVLEDTTPDTIETLELAGTHGRDNSSHMFVSSIGLWAAARVGFSGPATWHRGYNVYGQDRTLTGDDLFDAHRMLGYFEACAYGCARCGTPCLSLREEHELWLPRQHSTERVVQARGKLASGGLCLDASLSLSDCTNAPQLELEPTGALHLGESCVTDSDTNELTLAPCTGAPEQYWVLDAEGMLWNGRPPQPAANMAYNHVRCLTTQAAPTCGADLQVYWTFLP